MSKVELIRHLLTLPKETEWVEFKHNNEDPDETGEYISALANAAALHGQSFGYIVWGIEDATHKIKGTAFKPSTKKNGWAGTGELAVHDAFTSPGLPHS